MKFWSGVCSAVLLSLFVPVSMVFAGLPKPAHIVIVMEENTDYSTIYPLNTGSNACTYINNTLISGGALLTNSYGCGHQSEDNYDSLFFGNPENAYADPCPNNVGSVPSLASELLAGGYSFCGYAETLPSAGSTVCSDSTGLYVLRHCPWTQALTTVGGNLPVTCAQPFTAFPSSGNYSSLPTVSFVIPNLNDDMHNGTPKAADVWLQNNIASYATWCQTASNNSLLIVTWDEDATGGSEGDGSTVGNTADNHICTIFYGGSVTPGKYPESAAVDHYNVLATLEGMYGLAQVGSSSGANTISDIFGSGSTSTATPTHTATRTATPVNTNTPTVVVTATATRTATPVAPTATHTAVATNTPTATDTPVPPTHTPTPTPTKHHKG